MGAYCCCGRKIGYIGYSYEKDCICDHTGWNLVEDALPEKDGLYLVRVVIDSCDRYESVQKFSCKDKEWEDESCQMVYEWKEINE